MMLNLRKITAACLAVGLMVFGAPVAQALEVENPVVTQPGRYALVDGNVMKFQNNLWMEDGYKGGLSHFTLSERREDGSLLTLEGRTIADAFEQEYHLRIDQEDEWYLHANYEEWTRYYDGRGGSDVIVPHFSGAGLAHGRELALEHGDFDIEVGLLFENLPDVRLFYAYGYRDGAKSRLTWGESEEATGTRNILPSWQDIDEFEHRIELELSQEILGFDVTATQSWEFVKASMMREEKDDSFPVTDPDDNKYIREWDKAQTDLFSTALKIEKWFDGDNAFLGARYKHTNLDNTAINDLLYFDLNDENLIRSGDVSRNNTAFNKYDSHAVLANGLFRPGGSDYFTVIAKTKAEWIRKDGLSSNPHDDANPAPDGIIEDTFWRDSESQVDRLAEAISMRYTGIENVALYGELEFEQVDNFLDENAWGIDGAAAAGTGNTFFRQTDTNVNRNTYTAGLRWKPSRQWDGTAQYRHRTRDNDNNNFLTSHPVATNPESAFIDSYFKKTHELMTKITYKPNHRIRPSVRYKLVADRYDTVFRGQDAEESRTESQILTADLFVQPLDNVFLTGTYQNALSKLTTPAAGNTGTGYPGVTMNYSSWMVMADVVINDVLSLSGSAIATTADNFNTDAAVTILRYGAEYDQLDLEASLDWQLNEDITVRPKYAYAEYDGKHIQAAADYEAHIFTIEVDVNIG